MSERTYSEAGPSARDYAVAGEDPCGYVEEIPNPLLLAINNALTQGIQAVDEIRERDTEAFILAARKLNLAREFAAKAKTDGNLALLKARVVRIVEAI